MSEIEPKKYTFEETTELILNATNLAADTIGVLNSEIVALATERDRLTMENDRLYSHHSECKKELGDLVEKANRFKGERDVLLDSEHKLSEAYLRLRALLEAWKTPTAPTPEQIYEHTESKLKDLLGERDRLRGALEKIIKYGKPLEYPRAYSAIGLINDLAKEALNGEANGGGK